jgi:hypothetical protein
MKRTLWLTLAITLAVVTGIAKEHKHDIDQSGPVMSTRHMEMGSHLEMTELRPPAPGDGERAGALLATARHVMERYRDYRVAARDGYRIFLPNIPQKIYHFTNYWYGFKAGISFDAERPTSLLYEKHGEDFKLVGVMYTAAQDAAADELDRRVPLSAARWHRHVNLCVPPPGRRAEVLAPHPRFGLAGSISTRAACEQAGGIFRPHVFSWMVHLYPDERRPEAIWSVERQMHAGH